MPAVPVTSLLLRTRCFFPSGGQSHSQYPLLTTHRGMAQAESIWVPSVSRWFTRLETVTHPGTNRAQASSKYTLIESNALPLRHWSQELCCFGPETWNSLPAELRLSTLSTATFARRLKARLFVSAE